MEIRFMRLTEVIQFVGLSKTAIYKRIQEGTFPSPIPIGDRAVAWISSDISKWIEERIEDGRAFSAPN